MNYLRNGIFATFVSMLLLAAGPAQATEFDFSYTLFGGEVLEGTLDGSLQGDNDTIIVLSVPVVHFDGVPIPFSIGFVDSFAEFPGGGPADPIVTLSGVLMDLIACEDVDCDSGGGAGSGQGFFLSTLGSVNSTFFLGENDFEPARWAIAPAAVPESTTLALFALGLVGAGYARRRRTR